MSIGFYDYDLGLKPTKLMLNLEAMKIANYYNNLGQSIALESVLGNSENYDEFYICRNVMGKNAPHNKEIDGTVSKNIHHLGLAYSNGIYIPMEQKFEEQTAHIQLYAPYLREKIITQKMTFPQVEKVLNSHFLRLRAGAYLLPIEKLKRKERVYIYDYEIEKVPRWEEKLLFAKQELMNPQKSLRVWAVNGFKFTSFENIHKFSKIPGFNSGDVHLFSTETYKEFREKFDSIAEWSSPRDGIKYSFGHDINPVSNTEVVANLCLSINKYFYTKSIGKTCEFIVDDSCEISPLNKLQKDFQYWTGLRVGDNTLKEYFISRNKKTYDELYKIVSKTPYKSQFDSVCNYTKNQIKKAGWFYHV